MYYIYKVTNLVNGKVYIGKTNNPDRRKKEHRTHPSEHLFSRALRKYGAENFKWEIAESKIKTLEESNEQERYWIKRCNSYFRNKCSNGYNMTHGGDGGSEWNNKKVAAYDKAGNLLKAFDTVTDSVKYYSINGTTCVSFACSTGGLCQRKMFRYYEGDEAPKKIAPYVKPDSKKNVPVCQLDLNGNLIRKFKSLVEAEKCGYRHTGILGCIKGRYKTSYGFQWCYAKDLQVIEGKKAEAYAPYKSSGDEIVQFTLDGEYVAKYNSCSEAARQNDIGSNKIIHKALNSETHISHGYKWYKRSSLST